MIDTVTRLIDWVQGWDHMAILYSLVAAGVAGILAKWSAVFRRCTEWHSYLKAVKNYKSFLEQRCSSVVVIGRKKGFELKEVFVRLDTAPSDLVPSQDTPSSYGMSTYVLVGGPGAGKSTMAKHLVLERLAYAPLQFFVRLREYDGSESIDQHLVGDLRRAGFPEPQLTLERSLGRPHCRVVLDGLDEVRPKLRENVCAQINRFYNSRFKRGSEAGLVVTCRKEAYRDLPLDISPVMEVRPLTDQQIQRFAEKWPLGYPEGKSPETFWNSVQSTARISQLVRSPLLLVGALLQDTESTVGIPEERAEFLGRVANWLVSDWARAQGHFSDPFKNIYPRILSRLALTLHLSGRSECTPQEAIEKIGEWHSDYGYEAAQAEEILKSCIVRTGILVKDAPDAVIFSQFGLQEYFASQAAIPQLGVDSLARQSPKSWWREVILLSIAQETEPSRALLALLDQDALLAAEAVAECSTPPLDLQDRAVTECLSGIDARKEAALGATVAVLRRVRGTLEIRLVNELASRLAVEGISSDVGLVLARAGTDAATHELAAHPSIWQSCLDSAGFLSSKFENLLVEWIATGNDRNARHAARLLSGKLSLDRFDQLVSLLPSLRADRADDLATLLLGNMSQITEPGGGTPSLKRIFDCAVHITDPQRFAAQFKEELRYNHRLIVTVVFLCKSIEKRNSATALTYFNEAGFWSSYRAAGLGLAASALAPVGLLVSSFSHVASLAILVFVLSELLANVRLFTSLHSDTLFVPRFNIRNTGPRSLMLVLVGAFYAKASSGVSGTDLDPLLTPDRALVAMAACCTLCSIWNLESGVWFYRPVWQMEYDHYGEKPPTMVRVLKMSASIWSGLCVLAVFLISSEVPKLILGGVGLLYLLGNISLATWLVARSRAVSKAMLEARETIEPRVF